MIKELSSNFLTRVFRKGFQDRRMHVPDILIEGMRGNLADLNLELTRTLKVQTWNHKAVALCEHPDWGPCVYKSVSRQAGTSLAVGHTHTMRLVEESRSDLFPRVFHIGDHFTVEEYVPGAHLGQLEQREWDRLDAPELLARLKRFSQAGGTGLGALSSGECKLIFGRYLMKACGFSAYCSPWKQTQLLAAFARRKHRIRFLIDRALEGISGLELPAGYVIDDLDVRNVIVHADTGRPYVIDVEHLKAGYYGFDCVWLLALLATWNCPRETVNECYEYIFQDGGVTDRGDPRWVLRPLLVLILEIHIGLLRPGPESSTRALHDRASSALE